MNWLLKLLGIAAKENSNELKLDTSNGFWVIEQTNDLAKILQALKHIINEDCVLYFEGGNPGTELKEFLEKNQIQPLDKIRKGTIWPKQDIIHIPAKELIIDELANFAKHASPFEFAIHFHVYQSGHMILEWYDAFTEDIWISSQVPKENIKAFAKALGVKYYFENKDINS